MKITIDTKEDSHEDIQKVMQILSHVLKKELSSSQPQSNIFESDTQKVSGMMGIFDTISQESSQEAVKETQDSQEFEVKKAEKTQVEWY